MHSTRLVLAVSVLFVLACGCSTKVLTATILISDTGTPGAGGSAQSASGAGNPSDVGGFDAGIGGSLAASEAGLQDAGNPAGGNSGAPSAVAVPVEAGWTFVWSDEFTETNIDEAVWSIENTAGTPTNMELQYYTARKNAEPGANVFIADGALVIEAREEAMNGFNYTSGRLNTLRSATEFEYGRMEARAKLPNVAGMWPAFWMMGANSPAADWPMGGEIDIMEGKGRLPSWMSGSLHRSLTRGAAGDIVSVQSYQLASGNFHDDWHVFSVEWDDQQIRWYVDSSLFQTVPRPATAAPPWPFDQPFYFLLNLAVGGVFDAGVAPPSGMAPQRLYVDYVRVFRK
jgi:beta-glucanase (GH16 family)